MAQGTPSGTDPICHQRILRSGHGTQSIEQTFSQSHNKRKQGEKKMVQKKAELWTSTEPQDSVDILSCLFADFVCGTMALEPSQNNEKLSRVMIRNDSK